MNSVKIVTVGDVVADIMTSFSNFPIQDGDFTAADQLYLDAGGNANFLIAAARLGVETVALGSIGDDFWGRQVLEILRQENIITDFISIAGTTTVVQVLIDNSGGHAFVGNYGTGPELIFKEKYQEAIQGADALFCSGYSFAEQRMKAFSLASLAYAKEKGVTTYFDAGPACFDLEEDLKADIFEYVDVLLLTEEEIPAVTGGVIKDIFKLGPKVVVLKKGAEGCQVYLGKDKSIKKPGFPVDVVDTTAAGDSFAAAFISARCRDWDLDKCAVFANAMGAAKVKKMGGGRNVPTMNEVREILSEFEVNLLV